MISQELEKRGIEGLVVSGSAAYAHHEATVPPFHRNEQPDDNVFSACRLC